MEAERGAKRRLAARVAELEAALLAASAGVQLQPDADLLARHAEQLAQASPHARAWVLLMTV